MDRDASFRSVDGCAALVTFLRRLWRCDVGAIGPLTALLLIPIAGSIAIAVEQGEWYYFQRSMQSAADAAAIAAATNNNSSGTGSGYVAEAAATARAFGYVDGVNNASVTTTIVACPAGVTAGAVCYQTAISTIVPVGLSALVGFRGNAVYGSGRGQAIPVAAIATSTNIGHDYCLWSLSTGSTSFQSNGGPKPDLQGCSIMSNGSSTCNGHNLGALYGDAAGTNSGCGINQRSGIPAPADPYAAKAANIPPDTCGGSYPQQPKKGSLPASNLITGSLNWTGNHQLCGDIQLTGNVTLTGASTTIVIRNGALDLNGKTLSTASGASATIVFAGNGATYSHYPTGSGTLDIKAPTSGAWSGVALYQDPATTSGVDINYSGNSPAWKLSGLVYLPKANVTFSGAVNKSSSGASCFLLVSYTILVNGTGNIFANNSQCPSAGLTPPSSASARTRLVQ